MTAILQFKNSRKYFSFHGPVDQQCDADAVRIPGRKADRLAKFADLGVSQADVHIHEWR